jgi:hypothetical protein
MSELTYYDLVNDLKKLRSEQEHLQQQLKELARVSPGLASNKHFQQIEAKTMMSLVSFDDVIREYERRNQEAGRTTGEQEAIGEDGQEYINPYATQNPRDPAYWNNPAWDTGPAHYNPRVGDDEKRDELARWLRVERGTDEQ